MEHTLRREVRLIVDTHVEKVEKVEEVEIEVLFVPNDDFPIVSELH